jgi:membrane glycosyltransferase
MYVTIVTLWSAICVPLGLAVYPVIETGFRRSDVVGVLTIITGMFIAYFWLNGTKDLVYPIAYRITPWRRQTPPPRDSTAMPLVGLIYVTCNDFSAPSLSASSVQDYANCEVVILDDSNNPEYRAQVDEYALAHEIEAVRRPNRRGYKAGNLNNYLRDKGSRFSYFVIVDSDEILPPYFITRALDYFDDPEIGIVQANHVATRNRTTFMRMFAPGVDAHWPAYQLVKAHAGFMSLLGHGAMVSREAYVAAGGFPEIVSEDIGFAIDARCAGYRTEFAPDILCEEEFPPDYYAFKKRHRKWTEGNMEFMRRYTRRILFSPGLKWYERLDIVLFTYSLPLTGVFSLYVVINAILFPVIDFRYEYPLWMLVPTVTCLLAPMLNDFLTWRRAPKGRLLSYMIHSVALFGSMFFVSLFASVRTMFRGSVFHVTPKHSGDVGVVAAFRHNAKELVAASILTFIVELASGSILPVVLIVTPTVFSVYLSSMNADDAIGNETKGRHRLQGEE